MRCGPSSSSPATPRAPPRSGRCSGSARELLRDGEGWAVETFLRLGTHSTTHVDAPWHYNSTIDGAPARRIDELPLEWFLQPGVVLDFTAKDDGEAVTAAEVERGAAPRRP